MPKQAIEILSNGFKINFTIIIIWKESILRLFVAPIAGGVVGIERQRYNVQPVYVHICWYV